MWRWLGRGMRRNFVLVELPRRFLELAVPVYLVVASVTLVEVPRASSILSIALLSLMAAQAILAAGRAALVRRLVMFGVGAMVVYLSLVYRETQLWWIDRAESGFFVLVAIAVVVAIRYSPTRRKEEFRTTGIDYLIVLVVGLAVLAMGPRFGDLASMAVAMLVVVYAIELMITERRDRWQGLGPAAVATLVILSVRGFF